MAGTGRREKAHTVIPRTLREPLRVAAERYPVVTITGPRQSGKTTLCRATFSGKDYVSLEAPDVRAYAQRDPRELLASYPDGAIFDEVQRAPELLSYLQVEVDERPEPGRFVITGSQNLALLESVSQSLAGRTAVLHLLPCSNLEVSAFSNAPSTLFESLWAGGYPAIHDRGLPADAWLGDYVTTYVERDVRQVLNVGDLALFQTFVELCAGRAAQLVNFSALASSAGVTHNTARTWLSVLETGFLVFRLRPFHRNLNKRLVKTPKLFFHDTGLLCFLLGVRSPADLRLHPHRGAIFENWVVSEVYKAIAHRGMRPRLYMLRDRQGAEIDLLIDRGDRLVAVEAKSATTVAADFFDGLERFAPVLADATGLPVERVVAYGGETPQRRSRGRLVPWSGLDDVVDARALDAPSA